VAWFNDWYIRDGYRGNNFGVKLLNSVGEKYNLSCGIITPKKSGIIALKSGFLNTRNYYETRFPIRSFKFGFNKYKINNSYQDNFIKRNVRSLIFLIKSFSIKNLKTQKAKKLNFQVIKQTELFNYNIYQTNKTELLTDCSNYFLFIYNALCNYKDYPRTFWCLTLDDTITLGYTEENANNIKQAVVMRFSSQMEINRKIIIPQIVNFFKDSLDVDVVNILLDKNEVEYFHVPTEFNRLLPFFTFGSNSFPDGYISHLDKESTWS
jgi:hypothetical protein